MTKTCTALPPHGPPHPFTHCICHPAQPASVEFLPRQGPPRSPKPTRPPTPPRFPRWPGNRPRPQRPACPMCQVWGEQRTAEPAHNGEHSVGAEPRAVAATPGRPLRWRHHSGTQLRDTSQTNPNNAGFLLRTVARPQWGEGAMGRSR